MEDEEGYLIIKLSSYSVHPDEFSKLSKRQCNLLVMLLNNNNDYNLYYPSSKKNNVFLCRSSVFIGLHFVLLLYIKYCRIKNIVFITYTKRERNNHFEDFIKLLSTQSIKVDFVKKHISFFSEVAIYENNKEFKGLKEIEISVQFYNKEDFKFNSEDSNTLYIWGGLLYNEMKNIPNIFNLRSIWILSSNDVIDPSLHTLNNNRLILEESKNTKELADLTQKLLFK
jgi:hypothetical protein